MGQLRAEWASRLGILVPSTDTTVEVDMYCNLPSSVSVHTARMLMRGVTVADEEEMLQNEVPKAAERIAGIEPDAVVFACTSAGALHGPAGDVAIAETIKEKVNCPVVTVFGSVLDELKAFAPQELFVFTPYSDEINQRMVSSLEEGGVRVGSIWGMGITSDIEIGRLTPSEILSLLTEKVGKRKPDCVFASCTNLRAWEVLVDIRNRLGIPVVSSNFLTYRTVLRLLGYDVPDFDEPFWGRGGVD